MCYQVLFCITLFIAQWFIIALPERDWSRQYKSYDKEFHILSKYEDLKLHEFSSPSVSNFTTLYFYNGSLLVGARNSILVMNTTTEIQNVTEIDWTPIESQHSHRTFCIQSGTAEDECYNFVKVLAVYDNKLISCGTNSHYPTCMWREVDTLQTVSGTSAFSIRGLVSANAHTKSVYTFSDDGRFFSAAGMESDGNDKRIMNTEFKKFQPYQMLFTKQNIPYWLDDPVFHQSFSIGDYIYFFFDEFGLECVDCDPVRFSRVARICKGDNGGNNLMNWNNFVTYQKARLNCSSEGKYRYHFNHMGDIYWDPQNKMFYGVFLENSPGQKMSAICSYSLSEIERVFSGKVKYKEDNVWKERQNPGHIQECTVNPDSLARSSSSSGNMRMKTKSMKRSALQDQNKCILASDVVQPSTKITPFNLDNIGFLKVVVISIDLTVLNSNITSNNTEIWYIATDRQTVLKLGQIPTSKEFCIFEEYDVFSNIGVNETEEIKEMILSPQKDYLLIGSNTKLIRLSLTNCDRYISKSLCLRAQDPLCGWSSIENKCIGWDKGNKNDWKQHFTSCKGRLQRQAEWSAWSSWFECKNSDGNLCKCRRRSCLYARPSYQCQGEDNELANCTADLSTLTNKEQWWIYGAIHGGWSHWSEWTDCSRGYKNRTRTCSDPAPANGGLPCTDTNMEYVLCEPTRWDAAETHLWTSWTRVRGPERRVTRYKISCTSKSVVMKSLQLHVLRNETMNCTKELCIGITLPVLEAHFYPRHHQVAYHTCCGDRINYQPHSLVCCADKLLPTGSARLSSCCGDINFNEKSHICCENIIQPRFTYGESSCCGTSVINTKEHVCCGPNILNQISGHDSCCGEMNFNPDTHVCCQGNILETSMYSTACCGLKNFYPKTHVCCLDLILPIGRSGKTACCDIENYNPKTHVCCGGVIHPIVENRSACCDDKPVNPALTVCCQDNILSPAGGMTACCAGANYNPSTHVCCENTTLDSKHGRTSCCLNKNYDPRFETCCNGKVIYVGYKAAKSCCGDSSYVPGAQICCQGVVLSTNRGLTKCCLDKNYSPRTHACCAGQIVEIERQN